MLIAMLGNSVYCIYLSSGSLFANSLFRPLGTRRGKDVELSDLELKL